MPATNWQEKSDPGEAQRFEAYAEQLRDLQREKGRGKPARGLHAKGQIGLEARFSVLPDLPPHARAGLFAGPREYTAIVRYSNGSGARQSDAKPDVRGLAVKLLGVPGRKLIPGMEQATTQDFLLIRTPSIPFRNTDEFVPFVMAIARPLSGFPRVISSLGFFRTLKILKPAARQRGEPMRPLASTHYFTPVPIKFGDYAVRYALRPLRKDAGGPRPQGRDSLAAGLSDTVRKEAVEYDFQLQFFESEASTPIEDASVDWNSPWITVGRLTLPVQDSSSERGKKISQLAEDLSFDPWHAQEELRPIGNIMRARNAAYRLSTQE